MTRKVHIAYSCQDQTTGGSIRGKEMMGLSIVSTYSALLDNKKNVSPSKGFLHCPYWWGGLHMHCVCGVKLAPMGGLP